MDSAAAALRKISVSSNSSSSSNKAAGAAAATVTTTLPSISSSSQRGRATSTAACHWSEYRIPRDVLLERVRSEKLAHLVSEQQQLPNDNNHHQSSSTTHLLEQQQQQHVINQSQHSSTSASQLPKIEEEHKRKSSRSQSYTQLLTYCTVCGSPGHLGYECHHGLNILQRPVYNKESSLGLSANLSRRKSIRSNNNSSSTQQQHTGLNSSSRNEVVNNTDAAAAAGVGQNGIIKDSIIISSKDSMSTAAAITAATAGATIQVGMTGTNLEVAHATILAVTGDESLVLHHDDQNKSTNLLQTNNSSSSSPSDLVLTTDCLIAPSSITTTMMTPDNFQAANDNGPAGVVANLHNNNGLLQDSQICVAATIDPRDNNPRGLLHSSALQQNCNSSRNCDNNDAIPQEPFTQTSRPKNQTNPALNSGGGGGGGGGGVLRLKHPVAKQGAQVHFLLRSRATECQISKPTIKEEEEEEEDVAATAAIASYHNKPSSLLQQQQQQPCHQNYCLQQAHQLHDHEYYYYHSKDRVATMCGTVNGVLTTMLLDTGSSISAISKSFAQQLQLKTWMTGDFLVINHHDQGFTTATTNAQGFTTTTTNAPPPSIEKYYPECSCMVTLKIGDHEMSEVELNVLPTQMYNVTLGKNWLKHHKAKFCDYELNDLLNLQLPNLLYCC